MTDAWVYTVGLVFSVGAVVYLSRWYASMIFEAEGRRIEAMQRVNQLLQQVMSDSLQLALASAELTKHSNAQAVAHLQETIRNLQSSVDAVLEDGTDEKV